MSIRVAIDHRSTYTFEHPVTIHPHVLRLRPAPHSRTPIVSYSLDVQPYSRFLNWQQDPFGNYMARLVFPEPASELSIHVSLVADLTVINPFDFFVEPYAETFPFDYPDRLRAELAPYLAPVDESGPGSGPGVLVRSWLAEHVDLTRRRAEPQGIVDFLVDVNRAVFQAVNYDVRMEPGVQTPDTTLGRAIGSCRDSAWLLVSVLRQLGLAARFVSGYLVQLTSDDKLDGPKEDFTDLHAWAEVYVPGAGWIGLDATSGLFAGEGHIPLSATPTPESSAPITGATDPVQVGFSFSNTVRRVREDPRVTLPYTPDQWRDVDALGHHVDGLLTEGDVRLTMGGEPTFVSSAGTDSPQWEGAADGPEKRTLARTLSELLRRRWAAGGLTQHGQGKWYPGEPLPRWQIGLTWRPDGTPLWNRPELLDQPWSKPHPALVGQRQDVMRQLAEQVAARLGVGPDKVLPAFDDAVSTALAEAQRPLGERPTIDPDPEQTALESEADRAELLGELDEENLGRAQGYVVPLFVDPDGEGFATTVWRTRRNRLICTPGTSAVGLRLPLDSLAWGEPPEEPDPGAFEDREALGRVLGGQVPVRTARIIPVDDAPRTALAVEERHGHLFCFLPPIARLEDALTLVGAIEDAAIELDQPVVLEGYPLPGDPRIRTITVTPDPGVIEVNVHPTSSWDELSTLTTSLFTDAHRAGLTTEKFDLDGTHTGTGGGNHITLGGSSPKDSPLLRRPDLLRSLITFWQHHPALSYVFSGRFVGPTSQAPRVDEGRAEILYELEIAFAELERLLADEKSVLAEFGEADPEDPEGGHRTVTRPWLTDRVFRHLLTDLTGNTHRAEFCIDKMYSPAGERGRLGLLEMRGFEMPPHPQMSLVQALLVRSLVAWFWTEPYTGPLVRWGTALHDRFLLPAFAAADLREVVTGLNRFLARTAPDAPRFDESWFEPFLEFRFPRLGEVDFDGVHLELRTAVEPWLVLGEEVSRTGTSRYVDSSVERVQLSATGLVEGRHVVTCNGVPLPLTAAPSAGWGRGDQQGVDQGTKVAGVRYRAWAPPSALHPTIGVHSPLTFELVDRWSGLAVGRFTYHVVHQGGRNYDSYPVNAQSAEARRASRFEVIGHTANPIDMTRWPSPGALLDASGREFPTTLDLRRFDRGHRQSSGE
ncbi:MAG: transglutaminase family protein [Propionibacterium sp.]